MFPSQFKCCKSHLDSASFSVLLLGKNVHGKYSKMYWHVLFSFQEKRKCIFLLYPGREKKLFHTF